jgi:hypothetical protein
MATHEMVRSMIQSDQQLARHLAESMVHSALYICSGLAPHHHNSENLIRNR